MRTLSRLSSSVAVFATVLFYANSSAQPLLPPGTMPSQAAPTLLAQVFRDSAPAGVAQRSGGGSLPGGANPASGGAVTSPQPTPNNAVSPPSSMPASPPLPSAAPSAPAAAAPAAMPPAPSQSQPARTAAVPPTPTMPSAPAPAAAPPAAPQAATPPAASGGSAVVMVPAGARPIAPRAVLPKMRAPDRSKQYAGKARPASEGGGNSASAAGR